MNWIGQHIWSFISRFRSDVYLEDLDTSTETNILVVDSDGKITKNTGAGDDMSFTVAATTTGTGTTITDGDSLTIAAGTGITTTGTSDGVVTIANTVTDTNTMGSGFTVSATTDSNATTITQGDDLMFTAGGGITCETTADGTVTIANTGMRNFYLRADSGSTQTITDGNYLDIAGGNGISTEAVATDQANIIIDAAQSTITSIYNSSLAIGAGSDTGMSIDFVSVTGGISPVPTMNMFDDGVKKYQFQAVGIFPLHDVSDLGVTGARWKNIWLSELCTAVGLVAETSLTLDSVALTAVQTESETYANNDTSIMTSAAANDRFRRAYFSFEGYGVGDGSNFLIPTAHSTTRAPFSHEENAGSDGLTALNPVKFLKAAGAYMPYTGKLKSWKGWASCNNAGTGTMYITLFKYSPVADTPGTDSLEVLGAHSFATGGNNNLLPINITSFTDDDITAGDILMTGIKGVSGNTVNFNSMLEVEYA
jgi:hypothetical protein